MDTSGHLAAVNDTGRSAECRRIPSVLVVDDDPRFLSNVSLARHHVQVVCAQTGSAALLTAQTSHVDLALVDYRLRGRENGLVLAQKLHLEHRISVIMVSRYFNTALTVQAMKFGVVDCLDKPVTAELILEAVGRVLPDKVFDYVRPDNGRVGSLAAKQDEILSEELAARKLAIVLLRACSAMKDPRTNFRLARAAGVSTRWFREVCHQCFVKPLDVRDLVRILRAIRLSWVDGSTLASQFSSGDERTPRRLLVRAGLSPDCHRVDLRTFFQTQRLIPGHADILSELAHLVANSPLFQDIRWEDDRPD